MGRKQKRYHYIYRITCLKNNRYYIGMHSTENLNDGYMGGGRKIVNSVKKYGKEYHRKEILEFLEDRDLLRKRESEIITEELINDPMCMNLQLGGGGGLTTKEHAEKFQKAGNLKFKEKLKDPEYKADFGEKVRQNNISRKGKGMFSNEHCKGRIWITNKEENKFIKPEDFHLFERSGWEKGKTIKNIPKWNPWNKKN